MSKYTFKIKNYQIIKNAELEFRPGLTLLRGRSNNGKSSVFKAFKQLVYNTSGTDYIKHGSASTTLILDYEGEEKYSIEFSKGATGGSKYSLSTLASPLTKVGVNQPEQVRDLVKINKEFDYNFWNQLDKPFLISLSPREQFDLIQNSPHSVTLQSCLDALTEDRKQHQRNQLQLQSKLETLQEQSKVYAEQLRDLPTVTEIHEKMQSLSQDRQKLTQLTDLLTRHESINIDFITQRLSLLNNIPSTNSVQPIIDNITELERYHGLLLKTVQPINDINSKLNNIQQEFADVQNLLSYGFDTCPLCNQELSAGQIHSTHQGGI